MLSVSAQLRSDKNVQEFPGLRNVQVKCTGIQTNSCTLYRKNIVFVHFLYIVQKCQYIISVHFVYSKFCTFLKMYQKTCTLYKKDTVFVNIPVHCTRNKRNSRTFHQKTKSVQNTKSVQEKTVHNRVIAVHCTRNHLIFCTLYKNFCTFKYV